MTKALTFTPVSSSMMSGYHHDPVTNTLTVQFSSGQPYTYADVPAAKVQAMSGAKSVGGYFAAHIKPHHKAAPGR